MPLLYHKSRSTYSIIPVWFACNLIVGKPCPVIQGILPFVWHGSSLGSSLMVPRENFLIHSHNSSHKIYSVSCFIYSLGGSCIYYQSLSLCAFFEWRLRIVWGLIIKRRADSIHYIYWTFLSLKPRSHFPGSRPRMSHGWAPVHGPVCPGSSGLFSRLGGYVVTLPGMSPGLAPV